MIEQLPITHHIQKHIIGVLLYQKYGRFRDLRPPRTDTNLFSYHLKVLIKEQFIEKNENGYMLSIKGLTYVDRISTAQKMTIRAQPKIITMLVVQNSEGDILLQKRAKQPYIDTWTLPYGKLHVDDSSVTDAAVREASEKLGVADAPVEQAGDCYIRVMDNSEVVMTTLAHVFRFEHETIKESEALRWFRPHKISQLELAPAVEQVIARTFFRDAFFFEEYTQELLAKKQDEDIQQ